MPGLQDSQARSSILLELELNSWNRQGSGDSEVGPRTVYFRRFELF